ncbi:hypothetical protein ACFL1H_06660 [Nanoarchaeota archaeon]
MSKILIEKMYDECVNKVQNKFKIILDPVPGLKFEKYQNTFINKNVSGPASYDGEDITIYNHFEFDLNFIKHCIYHELGHHLDETISGNGCRHINDRLDNGIMLIDNIDDLREQIIQEGLADMLGVMLNERSYHDLIDIEFNAKENNGKMKLKFNKSGLAMIGIQDQIDKIGEFREDSKKYMKLCKTYKRLYYTDGGLLKTFTSSFCQLAFLGHWGKTEKQIEELCGSAVYCNGIMYVANYMAKNRQHMLDTFKDIRKDYSHEILKGVE